MNGKERRTIAVVGAGAAGLMAARKAARFMKEAEVPGTVFLLEGNPKPGKKLLATGNGRCNLTNLEISPEHYHGDPLAAELIKQYPARRILEEFEEMGLLCTADSEGRAYPNSRQAAAVLQILWSACESLGVILVNSFETVSLEAEKTGFLLRAADGREIRAEKCILACGGKASSGHSSGSAGYALIQSLGHHVTGLSPSLVPLKTSAKSCKSLKGMRCRAKASLLRQGKPVYKESGEVIFGENALSGICIFNLSARLRETGTEQPEVSLDLLEEMELPEILGFLKKMQKANPQNPGAELFSGLLNLRVGTELTKQLGIGYNIPLSALTEEDLKRAAEKAKDWRFPITGTGTWEQAQVTAGGVPLEELDLSAMESAKCPGLYLAGEILDADGDCGGYNLHWAWLTGLLAGESAAGALCEEDRL